MSESKLLNCPFCGGPAVVFDDSEKGERQYWQAGCTNCQLWMPYKSAGCDEEAVSAWNTRSNAPSIAELKRVVTWLTNVEMPERDLDLIRIEVLHRINELEGK